MIAVFTCDIVASRFYPVVQRQALDKGTQDAFAATCKALPDAQAELLSFSVVQGDEFQFSIANPQYFYLFLLMVRLRFSLLLPGLHPLFRCGSGIGDRTIDTGGSYQRDGSAYHRSRSAMESFDHLKGRLSLLQSPREIATRSANTILSFCDFFEMSWSTKQRQAVLLKLEGKTLKHSSQLLGSSWQNVQQLLQNASWNRMQEALMYFVSLPWAEMEDQEVR